MSFDKTRDVVVVTGAAGFIGARALYKCHWEGYANIVGTDLRPPGFDLPPGVTFDAMDISDAASVERFLARHRPRAIVNIAAVYDLAAPVALLHRVNVQGPVNLVEIGEKFGLEHLVQTSSATVYGGGRVAPEDSPIAPFDAYGESKAEMERRLGEYDGSVHVAFIRPSAVYGPLFPAGSAYGAIMAFLNHYLLAKICFGLSAYPWGGAETQASYVHVDDVIRAHLFALERGLTGAFNISDQTPMTHRQLGEVIVAAAGLRRWSRWLTGVQVPIPERPLRAVMRGYARLAPVLNRLGVDVRLDDGLLNYMFAGDQSMSVAKLVDHGFIHEHPDASESIPPVVQEYAGSNWEVVVGRKLATALRSFLTK